MRWAEIEARFPDDGASTLTGLLTHGARSALGLPARPRDRKDALRRIADRIVRGWDHRHDWASKGALALLAALEGEWDLVGDCTGGALPSRVTIGKTYGFEIHKLARHLAAVARARLPATHAVAAMTAVREQLATGGQGADPRALVLATQLFVRDIVRVEDPIDAARRWLDGEALEVDDARGVAAPADGQDPRVTIFERYAAELAEDARISELLGKHAAGRPETWGRHLEKDRLAFDDLVIRASVGRIALPEGWEQLVDPAVAAWLGVELDGTARRFTDLMTLRPAEWIVAEAWPDAVLSLAFGTADTFVQLIERKKLPNFKPGQFFKDDARKLLRYLASAIARGAREADVLPAWHDFLSRRSPATTPRLTGESEQLRWKHLLVLEAGIARLADRPRGEVGRALQRNVSGV